MDTYKENVHPFRMWRLNTHKQAFESCYLMTVFEDPGFVLMLPLVFSFGLLLSPVSLSLSSSALFSLLFSFPPLPPLPLLSFPPLPTLPLLSFPFLSALLSLLHPTSPLPSPPLFPSPFLFLSSLFSGGDTKRQALLLLSLQIGTQVGTAGEDRI